MLLVEVADARNFVTDLINRIVQMVRRELDQLSISAQEAELMGPVEPWDEGSRVTWVARDEDSVRAESRNVGTSRTQNVGRTDVLSTNVLNLYYREELYI